VLIFGSRAKGTGKPWSDFDLAVIGPELSGTDFTRLWDELDALPLVFKLDVLHYDRLAPGALKTSIEQQGRPASIRSKARAENSRSREHTLMSDKLTHFDAEGKAIMVEVGDKTPSKRVALAAGEVRMRPETLRRILDSSIEKGDVFAVARLAGIMAAKKTPELIPLCHPLLLTSIAVEFTPFAEEGRVEIAATVKVTGTTGVEMEALTAVSVAALTIYDMCKAVDKAMVIGDIRLLEKQGGKSGVYRRGE